MPFSPDSVLDGLVRRSLLALWPFERFGLPIAAAGAAFRLQLSGSHRVHDWPRRSWPADCSGSPMTSRSGRNFAIARNERPPRI
jgi:hypothetical protein